MLNKIFSWILGNKKPSVDSQITDSVTVEQKQAVGNTSVTAKTKQPRKPRGPNKKKKV